MSDNQNVQRAAGAKAAERCAPDEHHWVSRREPDFPQGVEWVSICSICSAIRVELAAAGLLADPTTPGLTDEQAAVIEAAKRHRRYQTVDACDELDHAIGALAAVDRLAATTPRQLRHQVRQMRSGWQCVDCGQTFESWPSDSEPCPGITTTPEAMTINIDRQYCECGHIRLWHSWPGTPRCDAPDCKCLRFAATTPEATT